MKELNWVSLNGKIVKKTDAKVPAVQAGLYYGAGCFETMLAEDGDIFRYREHMNRLFAALAYLGLPPLNFPQEETVREQINQLIDSQDCGNSPLRIRIQFSLIEEEGIYSDEQTDIIQLITITPVKKDGDPVKLFQTKTRVVPDVCRPVHLKLSNYLHYRNALRKALREGADDALMLTTNGFIAETTKANIFWKKGNTIFTPSGLCDILPGILRDAVIELIENDKSLTVKEGKFYTTALKDADTVWLTNSIFEIREVQSLNGKTFKVDHEFMHRLKNDLKHLKEAEKKS